MKRFSVKAKITFWFALVLVVLLALTYIMLSVISHNVAREDIKTKLSQTVVENSKEIEYMNKLDTQDADDGDHYVIFGAGFLEIDDDFCDIFEGIYSSLCNADGDILYGENPIVLDCPKECDEGIVTSLTSSDGVRYYLYDVPLHSENLDGLWIRGVVRRDAGNTPVDSVLSVSVWLFPLFAAVALLFGWIMATRTLKPIEKITATADEIRSKNDLSRRIGLGEGNDELHALAHSFDGMFETLEAAMESEKQFTSDASHELRTPTAVILAQCEYALEEPRKESEYVDTLNVIKRQAQKMSRLVSQMLSYTRLEQNSKSVTLCPVDLSELLTQICENSEHDNPKNISLSYDIESGVTVDGDTDLLIRMADNLIQNAYKYGKESGHVHVTLESNADTFSLKVTDDGIGIAPEHITRIFDRFYRADASRSGDKHSTGLGLSMVKKIVSIHYGTVSVTSTPGQGSVFTVIFPKKR